jgi:lipid II:glycine glycyltransferase (peptidoglycan interpeptide bridge formation enzyme)
MERSEFMTDDQIQKLIMKELKKKDISFYDMIGMPNQGVDVHPEDKITL